MILETNFFGMTFLSMSDIWVSQGLTQMDDFFPCFKHDDLAPDCKQFALVSKRFIAFFVDSFGDHADFVAIPVAGSFLHSYCDPGNPNH